MRSITPSRILLGACALLGCLHAARQLGGNVLPSEPPLEITTQVLADAAPLLAYEQPLLAEHAQGPVQWELARGALPPGLLLADGDQPAAAILGVPTEPGIFCFTLAARDEAGSVSVRDFVLHVGAAEYLVGWPAAARPARMEPAAKPRSAAGRATAKGETSQRTVQQPALAMASGDQNSEPLAPAAATAPLIVTSPVPRTVNITDRVTFSVGTSGTPASFQWQKNGAPISGANFHSLTLASVMPSDAGDYRVVVTNPAGSETSATATLAVNSLVPLPAKLTEIVTDTFADGGRGGTFSASSLAWWCSGPTSDLTVANGAMTMTAVTSGRHAVAHFPLQSLAVGESLTLSFDFSLTAPAKNGIMRFGLFNTNGGAAFSSDDANPAVNYTGYASYTNVAPTGANPHQLRERVAETAAALITGSGAYGSALDIGGGGPLMAFTNGTTYTATFVARRSEADRVTLTVNFSGGSLAGHTITREDISAVTAFDTVAICLYASGGTPAAQAITVDNVALVRMTPAPLDAFSDAERATQTMPDSMAWFASHASPTLTVSGETMTLATDGTTSRHAVAHFPAQSLAVGDTMALEFDFTLTNPRTDGIVRFGLFNSNGGALFTGDNSNPNVSYPGYAVFTNVAPSAANPSSWRERGSSAAATLITQSGGYGSALGGAGGPQQAFVAGTSYHARLAVTRTGTDAVSLTVIYTGGALSGNTLTRTDTVITSSFDTLAFCAYGSGGVAGVDAITVDNVTIVNARPPVAPTITIQPLSRTVSFGDDLALGVGVAAVPAPTFQWRKNGSDIAGATNPYLSFPNVKLTSAGDYSVVATSAGSSTTSATATLTVNNLSPMQAAVSITTQPTGQTVSTGANVTFSVAATGTPAPGYQWRKNGIAITGATGSALTLSNVQVTDAADYTVSVGNSSGSVISAKAPLVVNGTPVITAQPLTQTVRPNGTVILRVDAAGTPPLSFQWKKDGVDLVGATGFTYALPSVQAAQAGAYSVVVTNASGSVASSTTTLTVSAPTSPVASTKAYYNGSGQLTYPADGEQNRIVDFSHAGYRGGGVALPAVPVVKTISPITGDNTAAIQSAIDEVGAMPLQSNGYRGTVRLTAGTYRVDGTVLLNKSGVVLAGVGDGRDSTTSTILQRTTTSTESIVVVGGGYDNKFRSEVAGTRAEITTALVPVGARSFDVDTPGLYAVGDHVVVHQPSTDGWLEAVNYGGTSDEPWQPNSKDLRYLRYITAISGNTVTIDAPIFNALNRNLAQSYLYKYDRTGLVTHAALENLLVDIVTNGELSEDHATACVEFVQAEDCWARKVTTQHFVRYGIVLGGDCSRTTVDSCRAIDPHSTIAGARRYNFATYHAQLVLFRGCYTSQGRHSYINSGGSIDAGTVFLDCVADYTLAAAEPHAWWSTATLYDNLIVQHPDAETALQFYNAGDISDHGWCAAHSVAWRCDAGGPSYKIITQKPPTAQNYAIACFGTVSGNGPYSQPAGFIELSNQEPQIRSLYRAQLGERLGFAADGPTSTTLVNDGFADLNRSGDALPGSAAWFSSHTSGYLTVPTGTTTMMLATSGTTSRHAVAHFPARTVGIGESLALDFDFTLMNPRSDGVIRLGLFNRNGNAPFSADDSNPNVTYTGYAIYTNVAPTGANPTSFRRRSDTTAATLITQSGAFGASIASGGPQVSFAHGTSYHAKVTIMVTGVDSAALTVTYTGGSLSGYTVSANVSGIVSLYDTIALCAYGSGGVAGVDAITVDNVSLVHTTAP